MITLIIIFLYTALFVTLEPHARYHLNNEYNSIFGLSLRMTIASIIAFVTAQFHDMFAFDRRKKKTKGKFLWLRNNFSTIVSQAIDTLLFMTIAFYHISPKFTF